MKNRLKSLLTALVCLVPLFLGACGEIQVINGEPCIYVVPDRKDVYTLTYSNPYPGAVYISDGRPFSRGMEYAVIWNKPEYIFGMGSTKFYYRLEALGKNNEVLASQCFIYDPIDVSVSHVITRDGQITGGHPAPELVLSLSYDTGDNPAEDIRILEGPGSDSSCSLILESTLPLSEFKLWTLEGSVRPDGTIELIEKNPLAEADRQSKHFCFNASFGEFVPVNGISFYDPYYTLRHFYLEQSAADGSLRVLEFQPLDINGSMADN